MTTNRIEAVRLTTPVGLAKFPHLVSVDPHPSYGGDYTVQLLLDQDNEEAQAFVAKLEALRDEMHKQMQANEGRKRPWNTPHFPVREDLNQDGDATGKYNIRLKSKGTFKRGDEVIDRKLKFYDAKGQLIENPAQALGGEVPMDSKIAARISVAPYNASGNFGISLRIDAVQVIELGQSASVATAEDCGFGVHEGGFAAPAAPAFEQNDSEEIPF